MPSRLGEDGYLSPYLTFTREEWARLRAEVPLPLSESDLQVLQGIN
ncbi:MAG: type I pantothenate kinase, partial [Chloroflexota bacterium]|nr:type I pantothenate kinase [Chloroflexota bacterium]